MDTLCNAFNDQSIHIVNVGDPSKGLLIWLDVISSVLQSLVDLFSMILDIFKSWHDCGLMSLLEILREERLVFALEEWLLPLDHHLLHLFDVVLHFLD